MEFDGEMAAGGAWSDLGIVAVFGIGMFVLDRIEGGMADCFADDGGLAAAFGFSEKAEDDFCGGRIGPGVDGFFREVQRVFPEGSDECGGAFYVLVGGVGYGARESGFRDWAGDIFGGVRED